MTVSKIHIIGFLIFLLVACSTKSDKINKRIAPDRQCDCFKLLDRQERGFYLKVLEGEDTLYTGKCKLTRENGNEISYAYLKGHIIEQIERYPGGALNEEMYYDTTGLITKRVQYYQNGHISYLRFNGDHSYESFYEDGRVSRKGGFSLSNKGYNRNDKEFFENILFDSIWKKNGEFDSVYRYSQASITY